MNTVLDIIEENQRLREAYERACDAADTILAEVTAYAGRALYEVPEENVIPHIEGGGGALPAKWFRELYEATDRSALTEDRGGA